MKKVFIKYTAEVDDYEFERLCRKARIGKRELHAMLRDVATTEGLIAIRKNLEQFMLDKILISTRWWLLCL